MSSKSKQGRRERRKRKRRQKKGPTPQNPRVAYPHTPCPVPLCTGEMVGVDDGVVITMACQKCGGGARGPRIGRPTQTRDNWQAPWKKVPQ